MSSVATQFLYRNLVLDFPYLTAADEKEVDVFGAVLMSDGLRFVKTLKVGPIRGKTVAFFDRLIRQFQDHSLVNFEWDPDKPPFNSQLHYIWDHQWNIRSIDLTNITNAVQTVQPSGGLRFPQKYVDLSFSLPLEDDLSKKLDLAYMTALTVKWDDSAEWLPSLISASMNHLTNLQLHHIDFFERDLKLDQITSLVSLGLYRCSESGLVLSNFKNPKLKHFHIEFDWDELDEDLLDEDYEWTVDEDFKAQFSFIRSFQGLETLIIDVPDRRHPASFLENLVNSISLDHNNTLRHLALLDSCKSTDGDKYSYDTTESRSSVFDAVMACPHLVQLELPTEWRTKEMNFKVCIFCIYKPKPLAINNGKQRLTDNLPSLKFLCLRFHFPWDRLPGVYYEKKLPYGFTMKLAAENSICQVARSLISSITGKSSKLRLLIFEYRGHESRRCFTRGWSHHANLGSDGSHIIPERLVKYHIPEYEPMPEHAREVTWQDYCENKRLMFDIFGVE